LPSSLTPPVRVLPLLMAKIGLDGDKSLGLLTSDLYELLGAEVSRWTVDPAFERQQLAALKVLKALDIDRLLTFDSDSYSAFGDPHDPAAWEAAHSWAANTFPGYITHLAPLNEPDGHEYESSHMGKHEVIAILEIARRLYAPSTKICAVGSVTGDASYYDDIPPELYDILDGHFYAKLPPSMNPTPDFSLARIIDDHLRFGKPLCCSEIGTWSTDGDMDSEVKQADFLTQTLGYLKHHPRIVFANWFCGHPYNGWGLMNANGRIKPSGAAYMKLQGKGGIVVPETPPTVPEAEFVLGFAKWAALEPELLGKPLRPERTVYPEQQVQPTSTGIVLWTGGKGHAFVTRDGRIYRWQEDWGASVEADE